MYSLGAQEAFSSSFGIHSSRVSGTQNPRRQHFPGGGGVGAEVMSRLGYREHTKKKLNTFLMRYRCEQAP